MKLVFQSRLICKNTMSAKSLLQMGGFIITFQVGLIKHFYLDDASLQSVCPRSLSICCADLLSRSSKVKEPVSALKPLWMRCVWTSSCSCWPCYCMECCRHIVGWLPHQQTQAAMSWMFKDLLDAGLKPGRRWWVPDAEEQAWVGGCSLHCSQQFVTPCTSLPSFSWSASNKEEMSASAAWGY